MNYIERDIENILGNVITDKNFTIIPVGNHNIGRYLVYKIDTGNSKYIFKIYYIKGKRTREINSLKNSNVKAPNIIKYDEYEWIIMKYINGEILENIFSNINEENRVSLFKELGESLGKIHSYRIFDYALGWDEKTRADNFKNYKIKAIIDFEQSYPDNCENDLANLYFKYFIENKQYEKYFIDGYSLYMKIDDNFYNKLNLYLIVMIIEHCS